RQDLFFPERCFCLQTHSLVSSSSASFSPSYAPSTCGPHPDGQPLQLHRLHSILPAALYFTPLQHRHQPPDGPLQTQRLPHPCCHRLLLPCLANQHCGICLLHH
ncbi:hypothetical protein M9458_025527, partial [Cirrhinus mrigala]